MLKTLSIRNVVLIDSLDIDFSKGLSVLSGETGAGKSILLDSLGLLLGNRSEASLVRTGTDKLSVTGVFSVSGNNKIYELAHAKQTKFVLGIGFNRGCSWLPSLLPLLMKENEDIDLQIAEASDQQLETGIQKSEIDIAIVGSSTNEEDFYISHLGKEKIIALSPSSYINANAYPTGEFIHGHVALLNKNKTVIALLDETISETEIYAFKKMKDSFKPNITSISPLTNEFENSIVLNKYKSQIAKITALTVASQLLAYHIALKSGNDIDNPEGLNKVIK